MKKSKSDLIRNGIIIIFLLILIFFVTKNWNSITHINVAKTRRYILSYGRYSALIFVLLYSIKPIMFIVPTSLLSILAANLFGTWQAFALSMISSFFAGTLAFFLARVLGKPFVDKILKGKALNLGNEIEKHGFKIMLLMRLSFIFNFDALSYAAGLSKMTYGDFILGTLIGIMPEIIAYSFMGENLKNPFSFKFLLPIGCIMVIACFAYYIYRRKNKKSKE